jgi:hypothetical protein
MPPLSHTLRLAAPRTAATRRHLPWTPTLGLLGALALLSTPLAARAEQFVGADGGAEPPLSHARPLR